MRRAVVVFNFIVCIGRAGFLGFSRVVECADFWELICFFIGVRIRLFEESQGEDWLGFGA